MSSVSIELDRLRRLSINYLHTPTSLTLNNATLICQRKISMTSWLLIFRVKLTMITIKIFFDRLPVTHSSEIEETCIMYRLQVFRERWKEWRGNLLTEFHEEDCESSHIRRFLHSLSNHLKRDPRKHLLAHEVRSSVRPGLKILQTLFQFLQ